MAAGRHLGKLQQYRAVSLRQHGFLVKRCNGGKVKLDNMSSVPCIANLYHFVSIDRDWDLVGIVEFGRVRTSNDITWHMLEVIAGLLLVGKMIDTVRQWRIGRMMMDRWTNGRTPGGDVVIVAFRGVSPSSR